MLAILVSGIASAQEITVTELRVAFGPADRVVVFQPGSCEGSITRNGGAYAINTNVDPITFTWVGGTASETLNRQIFDGIDSNQEHGVIYLTNANRVSGNMIFQCPPTISSHFSEIHNAFGSQGGRQTGPLEYTYGDNVITYTPDAVNPYSFYHPQFEDFPVQTQADVISTLNCC